MSDTIEPQVDPTPALPPEVDDKTFAPIAAQIASVIAARERNTLEGLSNEIAKLAGTPERENAPSPAPDGLVRPERAGQVVAYRQPTDPLYRQLHAQHPEQREARTPDTDHWGAVWLRAYLKHDHVTMRMAEAKGNEAAGIRASTLAGTLNVTVDTGLTIGSGGHLLPQSMSNVVQIARQAAAVIAPLCTNFTTDGITLRVPTSGAVTADTITEGASGAQGEGAFTSEMLILHKIGVRMITSEEMLMDSAFNLMQIYSQGAGEAIGAAEDTQICTTNGATPNLTEAIAGGEVTGASTTVIVYEDLNTLFFALGKAYQNRSSILAGTLVCTLLSNMMDGVSGAPVLKVPSQAPGPVTDVVSPNAIGTVIGRPIYHVPLASGTIILGDIRGYGFVRKGGIFASMSSEVGFATDTIQFKFYERVDGRIIDDVAMKGTVNIATVA
jgi:HK97 family phage major capsid protein